MHKTTRNVILLTALAVCAAAPISAEAGTYSDAVLANGPAAYWRFSETSGTNAVDSVGGNDGTYIGGAVLTASGPQAPSFPGFESDNSATSFNGTNAAVNTPISFSNATQFTLEGWVKAATANQANRTGLFGNNDVIEFGYINDSTLELWTPFTGALHVSPPPDDQWYHIAAVGTGSQIAIYINGALAGSMAHGALPGTGYGSSAYLFNIGGDGVQDAGGNWFLGDLDEIAVYRTALSDTQILADYEAAFRAPPVPEPASATMALLGLVGLTGALRRRRSA
jgi:Concanavalin A-like lectin/glucanases superfamily/PEP-CTERM motif